MIETKQITGYSSEQKSIYYYFLIPTKQIYGDLCCHYFYKKLGGINNIRGSSYIRLDFPYSSFKRLSIFRLLKECDNYSYCPYWPRLDNKSFDLSQGCKILKEEFILMSNKQFRQIAFPLIYIFPHYASELKSDEQKYFQELLNNYPDEN